MNIRTALFVTTSLLGALALAACDSGSDGAGGSGGAGGNGTGGTGTGATGGGGGGNATDGWIRLAHMSPDSMGVDFCLTGADGMARASGYDAAGIMFPGAGSYVTLPADTYTVNIIGAGQDCTAAPIGTVADFTLAAGTYHTMIVDGLQADQSLGVGPWQDENAPAMGNVYLNACHENSGAPPVQLGTVDANDVFTSLFNDGAAVTLAYQECASQEVTAPIAAGTILAISTDGTTIDGRWTVPADLAMGGATVFVYGTDATDVGAYACINLADTCIALPAVMP